MRVVIHSALGKIPEILLGSQSQDILTRRRATVSLKPFENLLLEGRQRSVDLRYNASKLHIGDILTCMLSFTSKRARLPAQRKPASLHNELGHTQLAI